MDTGIKEFYKILLDNKFFMRGHTPSDKHRPYKRYIPELFEVTEYITNGRLQPQVFVTPKGQDILFDYLI